MALNEIGALAVGVTDFYTPDWLVPFVRRLPVPRRSALLLRHNPALSSVQMLAAFPKYQIESQRLLRGGGDREQLYALQQRIVTDMASEYARRHPEVGVVCYSYHWPAMSHCERRWRGPTVVFQVHPVAQQIRRIIEVDRAKTGLIYNPEPEETADLGTEAAYVSSLDRVDGMIAASRFTAHGLVKLGIPAEKVFVAPYGSGSPGQGGTAPEATTTEERWAGQRPLRLLFVGQLAYRKAPHHLFNAVGRFPPDQVQLSIVSRSPLTGELAALMPANARILRDVSNEDLIALYRSHHLFAMPSLVEGFGLVYQEALAEGLPVLCTTNTGGADIITHGQEGFVIPPGNAEAIADCIDHCLSGVELLPRMSDRARQNARVWTWERFREGVRSAIATIERNRRNSAE